MMHKAFYIVCLIAVLLANLGAASLLLVGLLF